MPTSNLHVAPAVLHLIWEVRPLGRPLRLLDVGPGRGKYAHLVREYVDPDAHISAVEAWPPYVEAFKLDQLYDLVVVGDVLDQPAEWLAGFDVVLLADVIEHIPKPEALSLLDRIRSWVVVSTPRDFFENPAELPGPEAHVSHWTLADFSTTGRLDRHDVDALRFDALILRLRPRE